MKKLWLVCGTVCFWISWPLLFVYLRGSRRSKVLVVYGNQVLLIKNWLGTGRWALPGGGLHAGEDSRSGAIRELEEETGIKAQPDQLIPLFSGQYADDGVRFEYECFVLELSAMPTIKPKPPEVIQAQWWDKTQLEVAKLNQDTAKAIRAWFVIQ